MQYRRTFVEGGSFFFTLALADRRANTLVRHVADLRHAVATVRQRHPFDIVAMVVLPEHLHAIWTLPPGDAAYPVRWALIKARFSQQVPALEPISPSRHARGERGIWQRRYWEHQIRDDADLARHVDYIHFNPVKHGLVQRPGDWPYSSIHRYVRQGLLPADWGGAGDVGVDTPTDEDGHS